MAITHPTAIRNNIADLVVDKIDAGGGAGKIVLLTAGAVVVSTCTFPATAFGAASGGAATQAGNAVDASAVGNASAVTNFSIRDFANTPIILGAVATSGSDINLSSTTIAATDTVTISGLVYTAPN